MLAYVSRLCGDCYLVSFPATAWLSLQLLVFSVSEFSTSISYFLMILRKKALCSFLNSFRAKGKITTLICLKLGFHLSFKMLKKWIQIQNCSNYLLMSIPIDNCHHLRGFLSDRGGSFWTVRTYTSKFYSSLNCLNLFLMWGTMNMPILCMYLCIYLHRITGTDSSVFPLLYPHIKIQYLPVFFFPVTQMSHTPTNSLIIVSPKKNINISILVIFEEPHSEGGLILEKNKFSDHF